MISVLVVEDEVELAANIATYLESFPGEVEVVTALSGEAALKVAEERAVDVVLTDLRLPGIDGLDVLRRVLARRPGTRVVVMTAYGSDDIRSRALHEGAVRFVEKPVDLGRLRLLLRELATAPTGWSGSLRGLDIFDFTQLFALAGKSRTIRASLGSRSGVLVFDNGEIVHAATDNRAGADAFYEMVGWQGGAFDDLPLENGCSYPRNVFVPTVNLVMEAARLRDEHLAGRARAGEEAMGESGLEAAQDTVEADYETLPGTAAADQVRDSRLTALLEGVARARYAAVLAYGGHVVAETGNAAGVRRVELWDSLREVVDGYPRPGFRRLLVEDGDGTVVVAALPQGRRLLLLAEAGERTGAVSLRVERLVQALREE